MEQRVEELEREWDGRNSERRNVADNNISLLYKYSSLCDKENPSPSGRSRERKTSKLYVTWRQKLGGLKSIHSNTLKSF